LEFNVPFQHKYGYIRDEHQHGGTQDDLFYTESLYELLWQPTVDTMQTMKANILSKCSKAFVE